MTLLSIAAWIETPAYWTPFARKNFYERHGSLTEARSVRGCGTAGTFAKRLHSVRWGHGMDGIWWMGWMCIHNRVEDSFSFCLNKFFIDQTMVTKAEELDRIQIQAVRQQPTAPAVTCGGTCQRLWQRRPINRPASGGSTNWELEFKAWIMSGLPKNMFEFLFSNGFNISHSMFPNLEWQHR